MAAKPKKGSAKTNPFTLSFGMQPEQLVHRYENVEKVLNTFGAEHSVSQAYLIEGIRGSGKTVLMTSISKFL